MSKIQDWARRGGLIRDRQANHKAFRKAQTDFNNEVGHIMKKLRKLADELETKEMKKIITDGASVIRDQAKKNAPRRSGRLSQSIEVFRWRKRSMSVLVGPRLPKKSKVTGASGEGFNKRKAYYGGFIEFGTSKISAKPYMRPAYDSKKGEALKIIYSGARRAVGEWAKRNRE